MMYDIKMNLINMNRSYELFKPIGIVLHETASYGDSDEREQKYFDNNDVGASAHAFVDSDSITQTIPWNEKAWHACEPANSLFLGVELCHATNQEDFDEIYRRGVWLFAYLFKNVLGIKKITKDNLMSHKEVSDKWHNTTHQDPVTYFAQFGKTVDDFRNDVQKMIDGDDKLKKIVLYLGDADLFGAVMVAQKYRCPLMKKEDYDASGLQAEEEIQIGGKPNSDRFTTFKDAASLV